MSRHRSSKIALVCAAALAAGLAGCTNSLNVFEDKNEGGWFSKPLDVFSKPDWARPANDPKTAQLGPSGPVAPEELVNADGSCAAAAEPAPAAPPAAATQASTEPSPHLEPGAPMVAPVMGGIALGMTECQAVRRAGLPSNVSIGADEKAERRTVLTYLTGPWPGIYTFNAGRLKVVERAPAPPKPVKPAPKKKPAKPKTAQQAQ